MWIVPHASLYSERKALFGEFGDDHVRIALVENEHRIRQAARNIKKFLSTADDTLHNVISLDARR